MIKAGNISSGYSPGSLDEELTTENGAKSNKKSASVGGSQIAKELSDMVNYCQATKFRGLRSLPPPSSIRQNSNLLKVKINLTLHWRYIFIDLFHC